MRGESPWLWISSILKIATTGRIPSRRWDSDLLLLLIRSCLRSNTAKLSEKNSRKFFSLHPETKSPCTLDMGMLFQHRRALRCCLCTWAAFSDQGMMPYKHLALNYKPFGAHSLKIGFGGIFFSWFDQQQRIVATWLREHESIFANALQFCELCTY